MGLSDILRRVRALPHDVGQLCDDAIHVLGEGPKSLYVVFPWLSSPRDFLEFVRLNARDALPFTFNFLNGDSTNYNRDGDPTVYFRCGFGIPASIGVEWSEQVFNKFGVNLRQYNFLAPPKKLVVRLTDKVDLLNDEKNQNKVIVVGHSLGGVTALGASKVRPDLFDLVISIATPVRGAVGARWFKWLCPPLYNLRPEEVAKLGLDTLPEGPGTPQYFNICLPDDGILRPFENSLLPDQGNTINFVVPKIKHNEALYHPLVRRVVYLRLHDVPFDQDYGHQLKDGLAHKHHTFADRTIAANQHIFTGNSSNP